MRPNDDPSSDKSDQPRRAKPAKPVMATPARRKQHEDDDDDDDRPRRQKKNGKTLLYALLGVGGVMLAVIGVSCIGLVSLASKGVQKKPGDRTAEYEIGQEMRFGDLGVTVVSAKIASFTSTTAAGRPMTHNAELVVRLELINHNPNRVLDAGSQVEVCRLVDDVGNEYTAIRAVNEWGLENRIDGQIDRGRARPLRSDQNGSDVLVFSRPVPGASRLVLTLDATQYGGNGRVKVNIPKTAWTAN